MEMDSVLSPLSDAVDQLDVSCTPQLVVCIVLVVFVSSESQFQVFKAAS